MHDMRAGCALAMPLWPRGATEPSNSSSTATPAWLPLPRGLKGTSTQAKDCRQPAACLCTLQAAAVKSATPPGASAPSLAATAPALQRRLPAAPAAGSCWLRCGHGQSRTQMPPSSCGLAGPCQ